MSLWKLELVALLRLWKQPEQKQVKINAGKIERRFGVVMTPFSSSKTRTELR